MKNLGFDELTRKTKLSTESYRFSRVFRGNNVEDVKLKLN